MKISPEFVKWQFRLTTVKHGVHSYTELKHHKCTDKDLDSFYPIEHHQVSKLDAIKKNPERGFICLDEEDRQKIELYGYEGSDDYQGLELVIMPCNSINGGYGLMEGDNGRVSKKC